MRGVKPLVPGPSGSRQWGGLRPNVLTGSGRRGWLPGPLGAALATRRTLPAARTEVKSWLCRKECGQLWLPQPSAMLHEFGPGRGWCSGRLGGRRVRKRIPMWAGFQVDAVPRVSRRSRRHWQRTATCTPANRSCCSGLRHLKNALLIGSVPAACEPGPSGALRRHCAAGRGTRPDERVLRGLSLPGGACICFCWRGRIRKIDRRSPCRRHRRPRHVQRPHHRNRYQSYRLGTSNTALISCALQAASSLATLSTTGRPPAVTA